MYSWISHTHTHLAGKCPHGCSYCAIQAMAKRFPAMKDKYSGPLRLIEDEFKVKYGTGKTIFIENCNDMWAEDVPQDLIMKILDHCWAYPENTYVFQTKNPVRYSKNFDDIPPLSMLGCTIETNRDTSAFSKAPLPTDRVTPMMFLPVRKFITIEPILDFDVVELSGWIRAIMPNFINIGADSKGHGLPEPSADKINALIENIQSLGIEIREKHNLERLMR
jgi:protein gp37